MIDELIKLLNKVNFPSKNIIVSSFEIIKLKQFLLHEKNNNYKSVALVYPIYDDLNDELLKTIINSNIEYILLPTLYAINRPEIYKYLRDNYKDKLKVQLFMSGSEGCHHEIQRPFKEEEKNDMNVLLFTFFYTCIFFEWENSQLSKFYQQHICILQVMNLYPDIIYTNQPVMALAIREGWDRFSFYNT